MRIIEWEKLPQNMQNEEVRPYYESIKRKGFQLLIKRVFDFVCAILLVVVLLPIILIVAIAIADETEGPIFYRQTRVTQYGKTFRIFKFRSMVVDADKNNKSITTDNDSRITNVGKFIRKYKLDEIPQLFNVISGDMTFVGTRPEVPKYVEKYTNEMLATLLLPAGITSLASIKYKDENDLIKASDDVDKVYVEQILPDKMKYNLEMLQNYSGYEDIRICFKTLKEMM